MTIDGYRVVTFYRLRAAARVTALLAALGCAEASAGPGAPCADGDRACAERAARAHPAAQLVTWSEALRRPLAERIGAPPPEVIEFLRLGVILDGRTHRPRAAESDPGFVEDVRRAVTGLPEVVARLLEPRLAGIFVVEDISGTAWADQIYDARGRAAAGMIALHRSRLAAQTANSWASWKENTPFAADNRHRLTMRLEDDAGDDRASAIRYILLHEMGHVLAIGRDAHPSWSVQPKDVKSANDYPYFRETWSIERRGNRYVTRFDGNVFARRAQVHYYEDGPKLPAAEMFDVYASLEKTDLPTLYAAEHPADDFAEAFASYVHTVLMGKPFVISIYRDGALVKTYRACWSAPRCAAKRAILERFLGIP